MSHTRGLKRKNAFLQSEGTSSAVARIMQEIEAERQKKERLEWYLNEVMKEKELLSRFDDDDAAMAPAAVDAFLAQSSCSTSASTSTSTSSSTTSSSTTSSSSSGHTTYVATDYNRWVGETITAKVEPAIATSTTTPSVAAGVNTDPVESCSRCGCQYVDSQRTCRCRNFESVKKRQRCLSRFVRTGHLLEDTTTVATSSDNLGLSFDLQGFHFVDPNTASATTTSTTNGVDDALANISDEDFLRMILDDGEAVSTTTNGNLTSATGSLKATEQAFLGEKSQRRRRASFVGTKDGWDASEEGYFAATTTNSTVVFGY